MIRRLLHIRSPGFPMRYLALVGIHPPQVFRPVYPAIAAKIRRRVYLAPAEGHRLLFPGLEISVRLLVYRLDSQR